MSRLASCTFLLALLPGWVSAARLGGGSTALKAQQHELVEDAPRPVWHNLFDIEFNETSHLLFKRQTTGKWWYDAAGGNEIVQRADGRGDRYCGSIHPFDETPCTHLVTGGNRYLIFPERNECCLCCVQDQGCGILSPNWLEDAEYKGTVTMNGVQAYSYSVKGLQPNFYYTTADFKQLPVELDQWPNDFQTLHTDTFNVAPIDPQLLVVPEGCRPRCPITSTCTLLGGK